MSNLPLFVASKPRVSRLLAQLQLVHQEEWQSIYVDPNTSTEWLGYPLWEYHGPGPTCLRRGTPTLPEVLSSIEESEHDDEVAAAAYYLSSELQGGAENYQSLVERLESMLVPGCGVRQLRSVALAVVWSGVDQRFNHRPVLGKATEQVNADYAHFCALAERAVALKSRAETSLGYVITKDRAVLEK